VLLEGKDEQLVRHHWEGGLMLKPSKKLSLALEAVTDIAFHGGTDPVQSQDIARRLNLPRRYLEQVMQQLVRAGLLKGVRGPRGGYRLARERRRISVGEIVRVVQGDTDLTGTALHNMIGGNDEQGAGSPLGAQVILPFFERTERELMQRLDEVSIEDLCQEARRAGLVGDQVRSADFVI
jgi:Rrf2 family transcriptional regulator, iron-sulfur cluster assembly transcription factor